jgi:all-trans-retinol dehydrogenase (NAD+)
VYPYAVQTGLFKKFKIRFESLMPVVEPQDAVKAIISAQRKGIMEISVPKDLLYSTTFFRMFPTKANLLIRDFLSAYVESDQ